MNSRTIIKPGQASLALALSVALAACGAQTSDAPSAPPSGGASVPPEATPMPSSVPPSEAPPSAVPPTEPEGDTLQPGTTADVTADGVAVRLRPGVDQPLIDAENADTGEIVERIRLSAGDPVVVQMGPVRTGGVDWYWVTDDDGDRLSWRNGGWVAGEYLAATGRVETFPEPIIAAHGAGDGVSERGAIGGDLPIRYQLMAVPLDDAATCALAGQVTLADGSTIELPEAEIAAPTFFPTNEATFYPVEQAGDVQLDLETDCSFSVLISEVTQG